MIVLRVWLVLLALLGLPAMLHAQPAATESVSAGRIAEARILRPDATPKSLVVYLSGRNGWQDADDRLAEALRETGSVVVEIDLASYARALDASDGECLYVVGELTDLAQTAQRRLGIQTYLPPILVGRGEGATFAYAAMADAPANTLGGGVGAGFENRLTLRQPFCPGAKAIRTGDGTAYSYGFDHPLPGNVTLFVDADRLAKIGAEGSVRPELDVVAIDPADTPARTVEAVAALAGTIDPFGSLPAVDLKATGKARAVAVFLSGDGGWRDLDKTMGEWLTTAGIHVVGLDSLRYFWSRRTPGDLATDIASIVAKANPTGELPVLLFGYSFGADTIPFAYPLLAADIRDRTRLIALLAPGMTTSFQVTIAGWLGIDDSGYDVPKAIAALPDDRTVCVHGREEEGSACTVRALAALKRIETAGGHHFDGDYDGLAAGLLADARLP